MRVGVEGAAAALPENGASDILILENLQKMLTAASKCLADGELAALPEICHQITSAAGELLALNPQLVDPAHGNHLRQRRKLLLDTARRRAFCQALLGRWRRSLLIRKHLLRIRSGNGPSADLPWVDWELQ